MKTDTLFYRLFQTRPQLLFDLLDIELPVASAYRFQSVELKQTAFRLDGVFTPPLNSPTAPLFFVEVQFQPDPTFYHRFFSEIFLYLRQFNPPNPWQAVVIYPARAVDTAKVLHHAVLLDSLQVTRLYLDELTSPDPIPLSLHLVQLIVAPVAQAPALANQLVNQTLQDLSDRAKQLELLDLLETIMVYKLPTLSREEIQRMIGLPEVDLKQTRFYQDVFTEGLQEGRQEGLQEGRQEGLQEGRQEGLQEGLQEGRQQEAIALALRLLRRKFGNLTADLDTRLQTLPLSQIEALVDALLDFTSLSDLEAWLSQQPQTELEDEDS